jgi:hypothetical protein
MHRRFRFLLFLLAIAPRFLAAQTPLCTSSRITGNAVGVIHIGMSLDSMRMRCPIVRDTAEMNEGDAYRVVYALVAGDTLRIEVEKNSVWRMTARRPRFSTSDSIRAGMPLSRFLTGRRRAVLVGEGKVFLTDPQHCGNSFGLSDEAFRRVPGLTERTLARLPRSTIIDAILVVGC